MITIEKLKMFTKYGGDVDMWARIENQKGMSDTDWATISGLVQDLHIIKNGLASNDFIANFERRLSDSFDNNASIEYLKSLST